VAQQLCRREAAVSFDLTRHPLVMFTLMRLRADEHWLLRVAHHITSDAASSDLYFQELALLYEAKQRSEPELRSEVEPLQYGDYAVWQRQALRPDRPAYAAAIERWQSILADAPAALMLPFARTRARRNAGADTGVIHWGIDPQVTRRLNALGADHRGTPYLVRLAVFAALLADETGERDIVLGGYVSERDRLALQRMLGYFTNLTTYRFDWRAERSFLDWLSLVRSGALEAERLTEIPYELLRQELRSRNVVLPPIQVLFHMSTHRLNLRFAGLRLTPMRRCEPFMPWGFTMAHDANDEERDCRVTFDARIYDPPGVRVFVARYKRLLDAVSRHPDRSLQELLAMSPADAAAL
jgi:hypothetical protein